jgi:diaminopimelate decarboxylase
VDTLAAHDIVLQDIDVGGGLGVCYQDKESPTPAAHVAQLLAAVDGRPQALILEPDRSIAANAGVLLTRVGTIKRDQEGRRFAVVDAAMTELLRPALYGAWHRILPPQQQQQQQQHQQQRQQYNLEDKGGQEEDCALAEGHTAAGDFIVCHCRHECKGSIEEGSEEAVVEVLCQGVQLGA